MDSSMERAWINGVKSIEDMKLHREYEGESDKFKEDFELMISFMMYREKGWQRKVKKFRRDYTLSASWGLRGLLDRQLASHVTY